MVKRYDWVNDSTFYCCSTSTNHWFHSIWGCFRLICPFITLITGSNIKHANLVRNKTEFWTTGVFWQHSGGPPWQFQHRKLLQIFWDLDNHSLTCQCFWKFWDVSRNDFWRTEHVSDKVLRAPFWLPSQELWLDPSMNHCHLGISSIYWTTFCTWWIPCNETKQVGGFNSLWKIFSSNWMISPNVGVKISNTWNDHLENHRKIHCCQASWRSRDGDGDVSSGLGSWKGPKDRGPWSSCTTLAVQHA